MPPCELGTVELPVPVQEISHRHRMLYLLTRLISVERAPGVKQGRQRSQRAAEGSGTRRTILGTCGSEMSTCMEMRLRETRHPRTPQIFARAPPQASLQVARWQKSIRGCIRSSHGKLRPLDGGGLGGGMWRDTLELDC
ncbi:hypothetical protein FIBSPDRAFT_864788 [Athelia psychrophila]|uniref:Uncharacterized protein n=1 Tax=Athelia psychrophila TaxID=1759441 RepID=A0A166G960_9AGAM|nr:hypothetical protein FIBSPDRAFT_864788 [Fibularhizoctonia sp. CBS 109695]